MVFTTIAYNDNHDHIITITIDQIIDYLSSTEQESIIMIDGVLFEPRYARDLMLKCSEILRTSLPGRCKS